MHGCCLVHNIKPTAIRGNHHTINIMYRVAEFFGGGIMLFGGL